MKSTKLKLVLAAMTLLALLPTLAQAQGNVPTTVSYQGQVTVEGEPFHGTGFFKFAILDSWGDSTWSNDGSSVGGSEPGEAVPLDVTGGLFNTFLGDIGLGMVPLERFAFMDPYSTLRVWFSPDGESFVQLVPDRPIAAVPYAFAAHDADMVDGYHAYEFAGAGHDHWGDTWSGSGTGLTLNSSGSGPTLNVSSGDNDGIYVPSAGGDGVEVHAAGQDGFYVGTAGDDGIQIGFQTLFGDYYGPADDGIVIYDAGNAPSHALPIEYAHDGIDVAGAAGTGMWIGYAGMEGLHVNETFSNGVVVNKAGWIGVVVNEASKEGLYVGSAGGDGLYVSCAGGDGLHVSSALGHGLYVHSAGNHGLKVNSAAWDGLNVSTAAWDGVYVGSAGGNGLAVTSAGLRGVDIASADQDGVFANTSRTDYMWGFNTPDKIQAMNVTMRSLSIIARNDGPMPLQAGDLVAVSGVDRPLLGGGTPMPNVRRADSRFSGVIGVVESRMELTVVDPTQEWAERGETPSNVRPEDVIHEEAHAAVGDAAAGEYVSIVVFGITDVKVDATAEAIEPGQRLTAADLAGHARGLQSRLLDGMTVTEGAPTIGIALQPLEKSTGTIAVFVTLQ